MTNSVRLPSFFIAGAARSGTTSLWYYLLQHPEIYMPSSIRHKEPAFFCDTYGVNDFHEYLSLFAGVTDEKVIGEASGAYLTSPESPIRIKEMIPKAKFIILLRNPVNRAYSLYNWMTADGYEYVGSFERALRAEYKDRYNNTHFKHHNPEYYYNYLYFHSGLYSEQISRYLTVFSREQLLILLFDELRDDPDMTVRRVFTFLEVDPEFRPHTMVLNRSRIPYSAPLQYFFRQKLGRYLRRLYARDHTQIVKRLMELNTRSGKVPPLKRETREVMTAKYVDDVQKTSRLTGLDMSNWLSPQST